MIVASLLYFFIFVNVVKATSNSVVIVNQVRGTECCEVGTIENLKLQISTSRRLKMPTTFTLRYDALNNSEIISLLKVESKKYPDLIKIGAFLEITPSLSKAARVLYTAPERDWYKTAHVYTPGYQLPDRLSIIDAYMQKYHEIFESYPELTNGWFMDTYSLNYLHEKYKVVVHEITREQWATDSYTLSGGPIHYPYISSKNWVFMPGSDGIAIIRQTVSDPKYNYGDSTSGYTSQPNDYGRRTDFTYYTNLINNAFKQVEGQPGFIVLGLENSMNSNYQEAYVKQLEYVVQTFQGVSYPTPSQIEALARDSQLTIYTGEDVNWISAPSYRLRIIKDGNSLKITDLRIYNEKISDPYDSSQVRNSGFFIAPYLVDGSRWYQLKSSWWKDLFTPKFSEGYGSKNDFTSTPSHISLPDLKNNSRLEAISSEDTYIMKYTSDNNQEINLIFNNEGFSTTGVNIKDINFHNLSGDKVPIKQIKTKNTYELLWYNKDLEVLSLKADCKNGQCNFLPTVNVEEFEEARESQSFLLLPTTAEDGDTTGTLLYPSSPYILFGRSPARVVILPRNKHGVAVQLPAVVQFETNGLEAKSDPLYLQGQETQFYDFEASKPGKYNIKVIVPGLPATDFNFYFAKNCRQVLASCLRNPKDLYRYARAIIAGKYHK